MADVGAGFYSARKRPMAGRVEPNVINLRDILFILEYFVMLTKETSLEEKGRSFTPFRNNVRQSETESMTIPPKYLS